MSLTQAYADWQNRKRHNLQNGVVDFEPMVPASPSISTQPSPRDPIYDCPRDTLQLYATFQKYHHPKSDSNHPETQIQSRSTNPPSPMHHPNLKHKASITLNAIETKNSQSKPSSSPQGAESLGLRDEESRGSEIWTRDVARMYEAWARKRELELERELEYRRELGGNVFGLDRSGSGGQEARNGGEDGVLLKRGEGESVYSRDVLRMYELWQRDHGNDYGASVTV